MAISFRSATEAGTASAGTTQVINVPAGVQDDDLLLLFAATADGDTGSVSPNGTWTEIVTNINTGGGAPSPPGMSVFWRIASSEPASYTITDTESSGIACQMLAFTGVDTTTPIDFASVTATGDGANADPGSINYLDADATIVVGAIWDSTTSVYSAPPTNYTSPDTLGDIIGNGGGNGLSLATAYDLTPSADPEDPGAFTSSAEQWAAATVALRSASLEGIETVTPDEFDMDTASITIAGLNFNPTQGTGTVYISDADTLAGSVNEVEIANGINTWSNTSINLDLTALDDTELSNLHTLGPGQRYIIVVTTALNEYGSEVITLHRPDAFVMSLSAEFAPSITTQRLTGLTGTFAGGRIEEALNPSTTDTDVAVDGNREDVWNVQAKTNSRAVSYDFRVLYGDSVPDTITQTPQVTVSEGTTVTAITDALTLTENTATVALDVTVATTSDTLTLATNTATVALNTVVQAVVKPLTLATNTATVALDVTIQAITDTLTVVTNTAAVSLDITVQTINKALALVTNTATVALNVTVQAISKALTLSTNTASVALDIIIQATTKALTLVTNTATLSQEVNVQAITKGLTLAAGIAGIMVNVNVQATTKALTLTSNVADVSLGVNVAAITKTLALSTNTAEFIYDVNVNGITDALALTSNTAIVSNDINIISTVKALTLTTNTATVELTSDVNVNAITEALILSENTATISYDLDIATTTKALTLSTNTAGISLGINVQAITETLTLSTNTATITHDINVITSTQALTLTENTAGVVAARIILTNTAALVLTTNTADIDDGLEVFSADMDFTLPKSQLYYTILGNELYYTVPNGKFDFTVS